MMERKRAEYEADLMERQEQHEADMRERQERYEAELNAPINFHFSLNDFFAPDLHNNESEENRY